MALESRKDFPEKIILPHFLIIVLTATVSASNTFLSLKGSEECSHINRDVTRKEVDVDRGNDTRLKIE